MFVSTEDFKEQIFHAIDRITSNHSKELAKDFARVLDQHQAPVKILGNIEESPFRSDTETTTPVVSVVPKRSPCAPQPLSNSSHGQSTLAKVSRQSQNLTVPLGLTQSPCDLGCGCSCHRRARIRSPTFLNDFLGSLLLGYHMSPWAAQTCHNTECRRRSKRITCTYTFPKWFFERVLLVTLAYSSLRGPEMCLRVMRVRGYREGIFSVLTMNLFGVFRAKRRRGNRLHQVKHMLDNGEASLLDVDIQGASVLQVSSSPFNLWGWK